MSVVFPCRRNAIAQRRAGGVRMFPSVESEVTVVETPRM